MRVKPTEEMMELAQELGVNLLHDLKGIYEAVSLSQAKKLVGKASVLFVQEADEALLSLAAQRKTMLGIFVSDITDKNLSRFVNLVHLISRSRVPLVLSTGAREVLEMRSPRDVARIGILLGLKREDAFSSVSRRWRVIVEASETY